MRKPKSHNPKPRQKSKPKPKSKAKPKCLYPGCTAKRAYYNKKGLPPIYCKKDHIPEELKDEMINVVNKLCQSCEKTRPSYNFKDLEPIFCSPCAIKMNKEKNIEMINVTIHCCEFIECKTKARFNEEGEKYGKYCSVHIPDDKIMVNVVDKQCADESCKKYASFNFEGLQAMYCKDHIIDERMINVRKHRICHSPGCKITASFGLSEDKKVVDTKLATHCAFHKTPDMIDVIHPKCLNCPLLCSYNLRGQKVPLYCLTHINGDLNYVNVLETTCKTQGCYTIVKHLMKRKYEGYCSHCFFENYPDSEITRNYKIKEIAVVNHLIKLFPNRDWKTDKIIGRSRKRPDLFLDLGRQVIIVEVDENKHLQYNSETERIMQLSLDVRQRPIVLIRFNPDNYKKGKINIKSCWDMDKSVCVLRKDKEEEWEERLSTLASKVEYWLNPVNQTTNLIEEIKLYFDEL
jgi:hypothetical protein